MASSPYSSRHKDQKASRDADEAEIAALKLGAVAMEAGAANDRISGAISADDEEPAPNGMNWERDDLAHDAIVGKAREEVERRIEIMGAAYPFRFGQEGSLVYTRTELGFYEFCLAASTAPTITAGELVHLPRDFERVVAAIVKGYLGPHAGALHTGAPRDHEVGIGFKDAMKRLAELTNEWIWNPEEMLPEENNTTGDEGMDFVAWKPSLDRRRGQIFVIGQCACGDDWGSKFHDLSWQKLKKWFRPEIFPAPMRIFATPHHLVDAMLYEAQREAGLVLDRARLTLMAKEFLGAEAAGEWKQRLDARRALVIPTAAEQDLSVRK